MPPPAPSAVVAAESRAPEGGAARPRSSIIRDAWAEDPALPRLRTVLSELNGYAQFRARVPRGALVLTLHLLSDGRVTVELCGYGDDLWRAVEGLRRVKEALGCS